MAIENGGISLENSVELRRVVYSVLLTQIQFGIYHYREKLPNIEETSTRLCVSIDTARAAYLKLKEEGYITLSKNIGATVKVNYDANETEHFIQTFFSAREKAMTDLKNSILPLLGNAQWTGLKNASPETLLAMEQLFHHENPVVPYAMLKHLNQKYRSLGNSLLMRLVWQIFMFLYDPFFGIEENLQYFDQSNGYLPEVLSLCRNKDWYSLRIEVNQSIERLSSALSRFYENRITMSPPEKEVAFTWSSYKKSQQLCYSIAMELLISISRGVYPAGSLLPSQKELARQKGVSLSTMRRALELLGSVGAIKSTKYVGTQVLSFDQATENSDFTKPVLQRRLIDMAESIQLFALSCQNVSLLTLSSSGFDLAEVLCRQLREHRQFQRGETLSYFILDLIGKSAPCQAIRTVYSELLRQFFWAYALRGMEKDQNIINTMYAPYYDSLIGSLENLDYSQFSASLEALIVFELRRTLSTMSRLGIPGVENILVPDTNVN